MDTWRGSRRRQDWLHDELCAMMRWTCGGHIAEGSRGDIHEPSVGRTPHTGFMNVPSTAFGDMPPTCPSHHGAQFIMKPVLPSARTPPCVHIAITSSTSIIAPLQQCTMFHPERGRLSL